MKRIDHLRDLRKAWETVRDSLRQDLSAAYRLATDPVGTLRELGYDVGPEARQALLRSLP